MASAVLTTTAQGYAGEIGDLVRELVRRHRARGLKQADATEAAARDLGISARRARAYVYGEAVSVVADEYFAVRDRFAKHLAREASRLAAESALLDARRAAMQARG